MFTALRDEALEFTLLSETIFSSPVLSAQEGLCSLCLSPKIWALGPLTPEAQVCKVSSLQGYKSTKGSETLGICGTTSTLDFCKQNASV